MKNSKFKFKRLYFDNRWSQSRYARPCDWVIFGISERWASPDSKCWRISFFGLNLSFWFEEK